MGARQEVFVPDIGDFKSVDVIEILVKPGDTVSVEQSLVTLESDKATMEIPSPSAGVVQGSAGQDRRQGLRGERDPGARSERGDQDRRGICRSGRARGRTSESAGRVGARRKRTAPGSPLRQAAARSRSTFRTSAISRAST